MSKKDMLNDVLKFKDPSGLEWRVAPDDDKELYEYVSKKSKIEEFPTVPYNVIFGKNKTDSWDWQEAIDRVKMSIKGLPTFDEPVTRLGIFPEDLTAISLEALGQLMGELEAWRGYAASILSNDEIQLDIMRDSFEIGLGKILFRLESLSEKKRLKEGLVGYVIANNKVLKKVKTMIIELQAKCQALRKIHDMYVSRIATISREISRRQSEMKILGRMD